MPGVGRFGSGGQELALRPTCLDDVEHPRCVVRRLVPRDAAGDVARGAGVESVRGGFACKRMAAHPMSWPTIRHRSAWCWWSLGSGGKPQQSRKPTGGRGDHVKLRRVAAWADSRRGKPWRSTRAGTASTANVVAPGAVRGRCPGGEITTQLRDRRAVVVSPVLGVIRLHQGAPVELHYHDEETACLSPGLKTSSDSSLAGPTLTRPPTTARPSA